MTWVLAVVVVLVTAATFWHVGSLGFTQWDDGEAIALNAWIADPSPSNVGHFWAHPHMGLYIPVTYTVWSALAAVGREQGGAGGLDPSVFHVANLVAHVAAALVLFALIRRLVRHDLAACAGAFLFAVHPVQVESVAWASGLKDVLCGLLVLAAVYLYVVSVQERRRGVYVASCAALLLATLAKPTAVIAPLMVVAVDRWFLASPWRDVVRRAVPWAVLVVPCLIWTAAVQSLEGHLSVPVLPRPLVALDAIAFYLGKIVWPARLGIDYGRSPGYVLQHGRLAVTCAVSLGVIAAIAWFGRKRPAIWACAAVFLAPLLPLLGLKTFQFQELSTVTDHYLYLSMAGVAMAAALISRRHTVVAWLLLLLVVPVLALRSSHQVRYWQDDVSLFQHAIDVNPRSFTSYNNLAAAANRVHQFDVGELLFRKAVEINPDFESAHGNLASMLSVKARFHPELLPEAIEHQETLLRLQQFRGRPAAAIRQTRRDLDDLRARQTTTQPTTRPSAPL
jgi:hypothetical protein